MSACLNDDTVSSLLEGRLDAGSLRAVTVHLDGCEECRSLVVDVVRSLEPNPSEPKQALAGALPSGATVGRYVLLETLGSGSMGIVYTARDPDLGRNVALKLLRVDPTGDASPAHRVRLLREAQATAALSHPNVVTIHDVGTVGDEVFLAMELVDGGSLREWMAEARSWRDVVDVMRRAGEGLHAAHAAGLVHRDFKPDNVLVGRDGRVRVTDFGLARASHDDSAPPDTHGASATHADLTTSLTRTGAVVGTPAYMAPEQLDGKPADARSDVFSFCVTLYEALYGERPFAGSSLTELVHAARRGVVRPIPPGHADVPTWLRRVVLRGLHAKPEDRPASMREVLSALDPGASHAPQWSRRLAGAGAALVALGLAFVVLRARPSPAAPTVALPSPVVAAPPKPVAVIDLPMPPSSSAEALRAYARGLQGMRDAVWDANDFEHATELDDSLAAAHLRYAMIEFWHQPTQARAHLAKAVAQQSALSDHDLAILRAAEAWMQTQPTGDVAFVRAIEEAEARFPMDAEIAYYAGLGQSQVANHAESVAHLERAIALDPAFGLAYQLAADEQAYAGDLDGAQQTLQACTLRAPQATRCLMERGLLDEAAGNCARVEQDARRMQAHDPDSELPYWTLAVAASARGLPRETVSELLRQREKTSAMLSRPLDTFFDHFVLASLAGDFEGARRNADQYAASLGASRDRVLRAKAAFMAMAVAREIGKPAEVARIAQGFLDREQAWIADPRSDDFAVLHDSTPSFWVAERESGALSAADFERKRETWARDWSARLPEAYRPYAWLHGYARVAVTPADAEEALAALPRFGGTIPGFTPRTLGDAFVGRTYLLAGRPAEALPYLRRASLSCLALPLPFEHTQIHLDLGDALAATGAKDEACAAYAVVLARWGKATPRSVSAEKARTSSAALACK